MGYRGNVEQAAAALVRGEDANWELARLTYENTFSAGSRRDQPDRVSMETWAADVRTASGRKFEESTGAKYKRIWSIRLASSQVDLNWGETYLQAMGETAESNADRRAISEARHAAPAIKSQMFQELASDPVIVEAAANLSTPVAQAVGNLLTGTHKIREQRREQQIESDPIAKRLDQLGAAMDVESICLRFSRDCDRFAREIAETLPRTREAGEGHLYWIRSALDRAKEVLSSLDTYMKTGRTDIDAFLAEVLGDKSRG